jgi:DNA-binding Lrp family transcriptional regulator
MSHDYPTRKPNLLKELYKDASNYEDKIKAKREREGDIPAGEPVGVVDPRYIGFDFLSYVFMETGEGLSDARKVDENHFTGANQNKGMMASLCFGDYDVIHRRAEPNQYAHARFAVDSKDNLTFCKSLETYPIFTVGRWHGQDVEGYKTLEDGTADLDRQEAAIVCEKIHSPNISTEKLRSRLMDQWGIELINGEIERKLSELDRRGVLLGTSVPVVPAEIDNFQHVIVGMTVEERESETEAKMPNEAIIEDLMDDDKDGYDGWEMPYIVSGVGQNWADIIAEMHVEDISDMNIIADELRSNIDGIRSTETYLLSSNKMNQPLRVSAPEHILTNQET